MQASLLQLCFSSCPTNACHVALDATNAQIDEAVHVEFRFAQKKCYKIHFIRM